MDIYQWNKKYSEISNRYNALYRSTAAQIALKFLVQSGISVIPKSVHADRIKENINIFDFSLTDDEMKALEAIDAAAAAIGNAENPEKTEFAMTW